MDNNIEKYWIDSEYDIIKSYIIKENFKKKFISKNILIPNYKKYYYIINNDYYYLFEYVFNDNHIINKYIIENIFNNYCSNIKYNKQLRKKIALYDYHDSFLSKLSNKGHVYDFKDINIKNNNLSIFTNINKNKNADLVDNIIKNNYSALYHKKFITYNSLINNNNSIFIYDTFYRCDNENDFINNYILENINQINVNNLLFNTNPKVIDIIIENNNKINDINLYYIDNPKFVDFIINDLKIINWNEFIKNRINYIKSFYFYNLFHIYNQVNIENYDNIIKDKLVNRRPNNYYYNNHDSYIDHFYINIFKINYICSEHDYNGYEYYNRYINHFNYNFFVDNILLFFKYSSKKLLLYLILKKIFENNTFYIDNPKIYNRLKYYRSIPYLLLTSIYIFKNNKLKYFIKKKYL
jgi:hypothetical protein